MRLLPICAAMLGASACFSQTFAVASLKPSARPAGKDYRGRITVQPDRLAARNVSLLDLMVEAYGVQRFQVEGPKWLDDDEFDLDARAEGAAGRAESQVMLQKLLAERFELTLRRESKDARVFVLSRGKGGVRIHPVEGAAPASGWPRFHGDMRQFANLLSIQLSIPANAGNDPSRPSVAGGAPVPVVDETGLEGVYDFNVDLPPELGADSFVRWQRALQDQLGLRLDRRQAAVEYVKIEHAIRTPHGN
jgi:uncharacterized protein (TIGR03435 family)